MADINTFNPFIVLTQVGRSPDATPYQERMCMWYELELLYDAAPNTGVFTLDQFIPVNDGVLFLRRPGDVVQGIAPYGYVCIVFDTIYNASLAEQYAMPPLTHSIDIDFLKHTSLNETHIFPFLDEIPRVQHLSFSPEMLYPLLRIHENNKSSQEENRLLARSYLAQYLIEYALRCKQTVGRPTEYSLPVTRAQQYIASHYGEPLTLEDIARHAFLNREYFCRLFTKELGITPFDYLKRIRIHHAMARLINTKATVEEIALSCGFNSVSYFFSVFRQQTGISPAKYRKNAENYANTHQSGNQTNASSENA